MLQIAAKAIVLEVIKWQKDETSKLKREFAQWESSKAGWLLLQTGTYLSPQWGRDTEQPCTPSQHQVPLHIAKHHLERGAPSAGVEISPLHPPLLDHHHGGQGTLYTLCLVQTCGLCALGDSESLEVNGNHPTTTPRCCRASVKEMSSTGQQRYIRNASFSLSIDLKQNLLSWWRQALWLLPRFSLDGLSLCTTLCSGAQGVKQKHQLGFVSPTWWEHPLPLMLVITTELLCGLSEFLDTPHHYKLLMASFIKCKAVFYASKRSHSLLYRKKSSLLELPPQAKTDH